MNTTTFSSVATQLMTTDKVELIGKRLPIRRLNSVSFSIEGHKQNTENPAAGEGHAVM
jgi:hypothetical protein